MRLISKRINETQVEFIRSLEKPENYIDQLCNNIYNHGDEKLKVKAMLLQTYFLWYDNNTILKHIASHNIIFTYNLQRFQ